jgi:hypothetical protein
LETEVPTLDQGRLMGIVLPGAKRIRHPRIPPRQDPRPQAGHDAGIADREDSVDMNIEAQPMTQGNRIKKYFKINILVF